jgi:hypothetical protein
MGGVLLSALPRVFRSCAAELRAKCRGVAGGQGKRRQCLEALQMSAPQEVGAPCRDALATSGQARRAFLCYAML